MNFFSIFVRGLIMGVCDLIPGISGGTVAFVTGIYERLINAVKSITPNNYFKLVFSKERKSYFKKLDIEFLLVLFFGIFLAIILGSRVISFLIDNFYSFVFAFFSGMILASSFFIFKQISIKSFLNYFFGFLGFIFGLVLLFFSPQEVSTPSSLMILFSGFLAIFALFLPGISGSFILLILGVYEYVINLVRDLNLVKLVPFAVGALGGVFVISRVIHFLFALDKSKTLFFLLGLVLGTFGIPIRNIYLNSNGFDLVSILGLVLLFVIGFYVVKKFEKYQSK